MIQTRFIIAVMIFFSLFFSHVLRGNLSIAITSMTQKGENSTETLPDVFISLFFLIAIYIFNLLLI